MPTNFRTPSDEIKHYTEELLSSGKGYVTKDIKDYIEQHSGKKFGDKEYFRDGMLTGVLRRLRMSGDYISLEGVYIKSNIDITGEDIKTVCNKIFEEALKKVKTKVNALTPMALNPDDFSKIQEIKETVRILKERTDMK